MEFKLTIELGNAAMQTGDDVAEALRKVAQKLADTGRMVRVSVDTWAYRETENAR